MLAPSGRGGGDGQAGLEDSNVGRMNSLLKRVARKFMPRRNLPPAPCPAPPRPAADAPDFADRKQRKLERIRPLLRDDMTCQPGAVFYDFLTPELRAQFDIVDTENVSAHDYDPLALDIIRDLADGMILDCGAGLRRVYYDNV